MEEERSYKKLTRSLSDKKLGGVCGGFAKYLNVDPTVMRILFLIAFLCGTIGLWVYLVCWLVMPEGE